MKLLRELGVMWSFRGRFRRVRVKVRMFCDYTFDR